MVWAGLAGTSRGSSGQLAYDPAVPQTYRLARQINPAGDEPQPFPIDFLGTGSREYQREKTPCWILDAAGGLTIRKVASLAALGRVYGVDYSTASVASSKALNRAAVESGKVVIQNAAVSRLPFSSDFFHLVTAVETHYYWPDLPGDIQEIRRVLRPGGSLLVIAETYRSGGARVNQLAMKPLGGALLSPDEHRELVQEGRLRRCAGFS